MKKILMLIGGSLAALLSHAQLPDSDIFVADMKWTKDSTYFGTPVNITNREGYDNHPVFAPNGGSIYFSSSDYKQCDIKRYLFASKIAAVLTRTKESEFSPGFAPDGRSMTVVRIDMDSAQRAYMFSPGNPRTLQVISGTDSIGYYCWLNDSLLAMFIVGTPNTLEVLNRKMLQRTKVTENIGRCLRLNPDSTKMYFVIKHSDTDWRIHAMNCKGYAVTEVAPVMQGNEDFAVLNDGTLLMGDKGILYALRPEKKKWKKVADFSATVGTFTRIVVSRQENKIALVGVGIKGKTP